MSANLKRCAKSLIRFTNFKKSDARKFLKSVSGNIINALSEIAHNVREGTVEVATRIKNSKLVKTLAQKRIPLQQKYRLLCAAAATVVIKAIVASVIGVLAALQNG